jgi:hypothetical protein
MFPDLAPALVAELIDALRQRFGAATAAAEFEPIARRTSVSGRLLLRGAGAPASVFVKYPAADASASRAEFDEELLALRFLESQPARPPFWAALLAWREHRYLVQTDLGRMPPAPARGFDYLVPRLARSLARLHATGWGSEAYTAYHRLRTTAGLAPDPAADHRRFGLPALHQLFQQGSSHVLHWAAPTGPVHLALGAELAHAQAAIATPGPWRTLIHDDLCNARQTFEVDDELYLLDFEWAKYSHALLDLGKPMLGKIERHLPTGTYLWNNPRFPPTLTTTYRAELAQLIGMAVPDATWDEALAAAYVFHALGLIGRLLQLRPTQPLLGTVAENRNGILYSLYQLLPPAAYPQLKASLAEALNLKAINALQINGL